MEPGGVHRPPGVRDFPDSGIARELQTGSTAFATHGGETAEVVTGVGRLISFCRCPDWWYSGYIWRLKPLYDAY